MTLSVTPDNSALIYHFGQTPKVSSIPNGTYTLVENASTPIPNAFLPISADQNLSNPIVTALSQSFDYLSRNLTLVLFTPLTQGTSYTFTISGVLNAAGLMIPSDTVTFIAPPPLSSPYTADNIPPPPAPVEIIDQSVVSNIFTHAETIEATNPDFYIMDTDPEDDTLFLDPSYNNGRITIKFSTTPAPGFISPTYFQVQYKVISDMPIPRAPRWQNITNTLVTLDPINPWIYIDIPSQDATPLHNMPGAIYYQSGFKYRVKIAKVVGTNAG